MTPNEFLESTARPPRLLVLGDLMLDRYVWGSAERVSPEAPILVLSAEESEIRLGGAASVANLLRHLEAEVTLAGVIGDDGDGRALLRLADESRIDRSAVLIDTSRPTTVKERFLARSGNRQPQQVLRVDRERRDDLAAEIETRLKDVLTDQFRRHDALLISDYAKGLATPTLLRFAIQAALAAGKPVLVDPARIADYTRYRGATLIKPNRIEAELALGKRIRSPEDGLAAASELRVKFGFPAALVTLDSDGMAFSGGIGEETTELLEPVRSREICDITGAGDLVLAVAGFGLAQQWSPEFIVRLANAAASLEIQRLGVAPVTWREIHAELNGNATQDRKVVTLDELLPLVVRQRSQGKRIAFTNGCFDLLHVGHVAYLQEAAALGDVLIVAINSDDSVRRLKGPDRPLIGQADRAAILAALECVDHVMIFDDATPHRLLSALRPDVLVKGGTTAEIVGREVVEAYGGLVQRAGQIPGHSTTQIVSRIRGLPCT